MSTSHLAGCARVVRRRTQVCSFLGVLALPLMSCGGGTATTEPDAADSENSPPTATISSPSDGEVFTEGQDISFLGSATDPEDGVLTGNALSWESDVEGEIGVGESFSRNDLSEGNHVITLIADDKEGATGSASVNITVDAPSGLDRNMAFVSDRSGNDDIWLLKPDGSGPINLTNDPSSDISPQWSPDGTKIAFVRSPGGNLDFDCQLWVMDADGSNPFQLASIGCGDGDAHHWSPDGTELAFVYGDIWKTGADGSGQTCLTCEETDDFEYIFRNPKSPRWSPDGTKIAFRATYVTEHIWVMDANGTNATQLSDSESPNEYDYHPRWSPDGTQIAFVRNFVGHTGILAMAADGSNPTIVTKLNGDEERQEWSPDGTQIAFWRALDVWVVNSDGSEPRSLTGGTTDILNPKFREGHWSPDGDQLAFSNFSDGDEIWVIGLDGSAPVRLTEDPAHDTEPRWRP